MPLITISETADFDQSPNAVVSFDRQEFPITVKDPFSEKEEKLLEWYFEEYLKFPFTKQVEYQEADQSVTTYGEALFAQIFGSNPKVYAKYSQAIQQGIHSLSFEIIGSPEFHRLHWEALKDPELPDPFVIHAPMIRLAVKAPVISIQPKESPTINLLVVTARPGGRQDIGYRTISRPLVDSLRNAKLPVKIDILRPGTYPALMAHLDAIREKHGTGFYHIIHFDLHGALMTFGQMQQSCENDCLMFKRYGRSEITEYSGKKAFLFFESETQDKSDPAEAAEIANLLISHHVPIVILNACQSGKQIIGDVETSLGSRLLQAGVRNVLAMGYSVTVSAAALMMQSLYRHLFDKNNLSHAVRHARAALHADKERQAYFNQKIGLQDWLLPVAYSGAGAQPALPLRAMSFEEQAAHLFSEASLYKAPELTYGFLGRDLDILQIEKRLLSKSEGKTRNLLLIRGMGGAGKTSLLHHLMEWWQKTGFVREVFYFGYDEKAYKLSQIMDNIAEKLFSTEPIPKGFAVSPQLSAFRNMALPLQQQYLCKILRNERHLLVLDNLESVTGEYLAVRNTLTDKERNDIRAFLADLLNGETPVLMGTRGGEDWLVSGQNAPLRKNDIYDLPGLDSEAASTLAQRIFERHVPDRKKRDQYRQSKEFQYLMKVLDGYPLPMEVVLANLSFQTPAQIAEALQAGDINLDAKNAQEKTDSILKCIDYSHSALSEDAQKMLLCLAPFTGVIFAQWLPQYSECLKKQPVLAGLPFDKWHEIISECVNRGLMGAHERPGYITLQPIFPYFLRSRLTVADKALKKAIETGFRELYGSFGRYFGQLLDSKEPQERKLGLAVTRLEYENLMTGLKLALEDQVSIGGCYVVLNNYYRAIQDYPKAMSVAQAVLSELKKYPNEKISENIRMERIQVTADIANTYLIIKQHDQAEETYLDILNYLKEIKAVEGKKSWNCEAITYHQLGRVAQEQRQWEQAENYFQNALRIFIEFDDRYSQATTYHQLGMVAQEQRQWEQAEKYFQNALRLHIDRDSQASIYQSLGIGASYRHQWEQAEMYFQNALGIKIEIDDRYSQASTYHNLGMVAQEQRQWEQAEKYFDNALRIFIEFDDRYSQAKTYQSLGIVAQRQQQWEQAEMYFQNALRIFIEFDDRYEQAKSYHNLGAVARQWEQAENYVQNALRIFIEFDDHYSQAAVYIQLGGIVQEQRQWEQAEMYFQNALRIFIEFDDRYYQAHTYQHLGSVAKYQHQWEQAREYYLKALKIYIEYEDEYHKNMCLSNLSILYSETQDPALPAAVAGVLGISAEEAGEMLAGG